MRNLISCLFIILLSCPVFLLAEDAPAAGPSMYDLPRCLNEALQNNHDLRQARERIEREHGVTLMAQGAMLPQLGLSSYYQDTDKGLLPEQTRDSIDNNKDWSASAEVRQPLFAGGKLVAGYRQQSLHQEAAQHEYDAAQNTVMSTVKQRFYAVLLARSRVIVQEEMLKLLEEELRSEESKRDAGVVSDFNVLRAEVELANNRAPHIKAQNEARITLDELGQVLGLTGPALQSTTARLDIAGELSFEPFAVKLEDALTSAYEKRPELKQLELRQQAARQGIKIAQAGYLPAIDLVGGYDVRKSGYSDRLGDELHGWKAGVQGQWTVFDSFQTAGDVSRARSEEALARTQLEQARVNVEVEVRRAWSSLIEANELVRASQKVVEQARESLRLARSRFDAGVATQLEVLDTQVALTDARNNEVQALYQYNVARASLEQAMGEKGLPKSN